VRNSDESRIITFTRTDLTETLLVAINLSSRPFTGTMKLGAGGYSYLIGAAPQGGRSQVPLPALALAAWEFRVFRKQQ
jgi:hypothetical protein